MGIKQSELRNYYKTIFKGLKATPEGRKTFTLLKSDIQEYISDYPEATLKCIIHKFGSPHDIIRDNTSKVPIKNLKKQRNYGNLIVWGLVVAAAVVVVVMLLCIIDGFITNSHPLGL